MGNCSMCFKSLRFYNKEYKCAMCGVTLCSVCAKEIKNKAGLCSELECVLGKPFVYTTHFLDKDYRMCPSCLRIYGLMTNKLCDILENPPYVEIVSENYRGKKHYVGEKKFLKTDYYKNWDDAKDCLKTAAAYLGCDMLIHVRKIKRECEEPTDRGGTYRYAMWSYEGYAVKKK